MITTMEAPTTTSTDDELSRIISDANTARSQADPTKALTTVVAGLKLASNGERAADEAFSLAEEFGSSWEQADIDREFGELDYSETTLAKYKLVARIITTDGVKRAGKQDWRVLRAAIGLVPKNQLHNIVPRVTNKVKAVRENRPDGTISYATVRTICEDIAREAKPPRMTEDTALQMRVTTAHNGVLFTQAALAEGKTLSDASISKLEAMSVMIADMLASLNK